jgi:CRISPR/Cas system-associated exonuclease Cas4 (RecB family)
MAVLPESQHTTATAIVKWYESKPQEHRPHMGASLIGHPCERNIWLTWRWALKPEFQGRILRLFSTGQREEPRLLEELRGIGAEVWDTDPATGDQWRVSAHDGHFSGSLDGVAKGLPEGPKTVAVLEFKTHSQKSWADVKAKGVQASKPQHYAQMTVYMGLMELTRALYIAVNKDTDDVYTEWVHFDQEHFDWAMRRAKTLIEMTQPPERLSNDPSHWQCKFCGFYKHCHQQQAAEVNCRTCCHSTPGSNASWICTEHGNDPIPLEFQRKGCDAHLLIPGLVPFGEPVDGGSNWVAYKHKESGKHFINGPAELSDSTYGPAFTSRELHLAAGPVIDFVADVKEVFPGATVVSGSVTHALTGSAFDDMESDDLDAIPTTRDTPAKRESRKKIAASIKQLEAMR